jgi:hypothetical protein
MDGIDLRADAMNPEVRHFIRAEYLKHLLAMASGSIERRLRLQSGYATSSRRRLFFVFLFQCFQLSVARRCLVAM